MTDACSPGRSAASFSNGKTSSEEGNRRLRDTRVHNKGVKKVRDTIWCTLHQCAMKQVQALHSSDSTSEHGAYEGGHRRSPRLPTTQPFLFRKLTPHQLGRFFQGTLRVFRAVVMDTVARAEIEGMYKCEENNRQEQML